MTTLLLITRENEERQRISRFLSEAEYTVYNTNDFHFATTLINQQDQIHVLICDAAMLTGDISVVELRKLKGRCLLIVFADAAQLSNLEHIKSEIVTIITKPVQKQILLDAVLKCLIMQAQADALHSIQSQIQDRIQKVFDTHLRQTSPDLAGNVDQLNAMLNPSTSSEITRVRELTVDYLRSGVSYKGKPLPLTPTEFDILSLFIQEAGRVVTFEEIVYVLQKQKLSRTDARRMLSAHITNLRTKMREAGCDHYLVNSRGRGYMIESDVETSLRTKDMQLHLLLDQVPILIWTTDTQLTVTSMIGDFVLDQLGRNSDDIIGISLYEFWPDETNIPAISGHYRALQGKTIQYEQNWRGRTFETYVQPLYQDREIIGCVGIGIDITDRKRIEAQLRSSQHFTEQIIRTNPNLIYVCDLAEKRIIYIHDLVKSLFGYTPEQVIELGYEFFEAVVHPEDIYFIEELTHRFKFLVNNEVLHRELRMRYANGEWGWFHLREVIFERDAQGQPLQILGNIEDITERRSKRQALREEKTKFEAVWNQAADAMVLSDSAGIVINANQAYFELYGYSADEIIGKDFSIVFNEDMREAIQHDYKALFADPSLNRGSYEREVQKKDGTQRIVEAKVAFITLENQEKLLLSLIRDVTEKRRAVEKLLQGENHFRMISELMTDYAYGFEVTPDGQLLLDWVTAEFESVVGYAREQVVQRGGWRSILYPEDEAIARNRLQKLLSGQDDISEFRIITASNEIRWFRDFAHPIWNAEMSQIIYIVGAAQDITKLKT